MSVDLLPLLRELTIAGLAFTQSNRGQTSEARVHAVLAGQAGQAVTTEAELSGLFKSNGAFSTLTTKRFIRLVDTNDGSNTICPIAFVDGDLSGKHPYLRIQLVLITYTAQQNTASQCLLIRFETPEGGDPAGTGMHDYYHSQLCAELRIDRSPKTFGISKSIAWGAASCPAWPIDASTPLQLLTCVVFALYGKTEGARILRKAYANSFDELIEEMHFTFPAKVAVPQLPSPTAAKSKKKKPRRKRR